MYGFRRGSGTHKVLEMDNAFLHVFDLFHDHGVDIAVFLQHKKILLDAQAIYYNFIRKSRK